MSTTSAPAADAPGGAAGSAAPVVRAARSKPGTSLLAHGQPAIWMTGGALAICLFMIASLLLIIFLQGLATFWPAPVVLVHLTDGKTAYLGEVIREDTYRPARDAFDVLPPDQRAGAMALVEQHGGFSQRRLFRTDNFELTGTHHNWVSDFALAQESRAPWALVVERLTNDGRFFGIPSAFKEDGKVVATEPDAAWAKFQEYHPGVYARHQQREETRRRDGEVSRKEEDARLALREAEIKYGVSSRQSGAAADRLIAVLADAVREHEKWGKEIAALNQQNDRYVLVLTTATGDKKDMKLGDVLRAYPANQLTTWNKLMIYLVRWWEFLSGDPHTNRSEGGVFPAIWGTVTMTLLMSVCVVPFGVLAALYLREYAKAGPIVSAVRIAINNLAGVPSIVFGVFGLGFFCYIIGGRIDQLFFQANLPSPTFGKGGLLWASLTLALLTLPVVIVATEEALAAVPGSMREGSYACGASKWQTIHRIVLPRALPGILTGTILAMARGAGEVAPLMLVGAVNMAAALPMDGVFPFVHPNRSFMHLGFHIYDVGLQSQDSESAKPMVFSTTLLLITLIALMNVLAMWLRGRLRKRYLGSQF
jgi:phosphate transport system permease protein